MKQNIITQVLYSGDWIWTNFDLKLSKGIRPSLHENGISRNIVFTHDQEREDNKMPTLLTWRDVALDEFSTDMKANPLAF